MWIFFALLAPALYGIAEIFDEYLSNKKFNSTFSLIFYASIFNLVFVPFILILFPPSIPAKDLWVPLIFTGLTGILYCFPYYKALQLEDTSVVSAFFSFGKIIIPVFAFLFLGELLTPLQYIGLAVVILGNIVLGFHRSKKKIKISKAFFLIVLASTILALGDIVLKYMFEKGISWATVMSGQLLISSFFSIFFLLARDGRNIIKKDWTNFTGSFKAFFSEELCTFLAMAAEVYAIQQAPLSLVKGIGLTIPLFILSYTIIFKRYMPRAFHEHIEKSVLLKRIPLYCLIILGLVLVGFHE
jgi:drug/metabolite transporter (DMT)-like permease